MSSDASVQYAELRPLAVPLLTGFLMNTLLYGCLVIQVYWYYMAFPKDPRKLRVFVFFLFICETIQTALICNDAIKGYALDFGSTGALDNVQTAWLNIPIMTGFISCCVHGFFSWRIYTLSESIFSVAAIMTMSVFQFICGLYSGIKIEMLGSYAVVQEKETVPIAMWLAGSAATDVLIAILMSYFLWSMPKSFERTKILISRLLRMTIETGAITAVFAVVIVILFAAVRSGSYYACLGAMLAKLYTNVVLAVLNSRIRIINGREEYGTDRFGALSINTSTIARSQEHHNASVYDIHVTSSSRPSQGIVFYKTQETWVDEGDKGNIPLEAMQGESSGPQDDKATRDVHVFV